MNKDAKVILQMTRVLQLVIGGERRQRKLHFLFQQFGQIFELRLHLVHLC